MRSRNANEIIAGAYAERFTNSIIYAHNAYKIGAKTLKDIAQIFYIKIDEHRLSDYDLISINYSDQVFLKFIDKKYNTLYTAKFILSYYTGELAYISIAISSPAKMIDKLINARDGRLIESKVTFIHNGYGLTFDKQYSNVTQDYYRTDNKLTIKCYRDDLTCPHNETSIFVKSYVEHNELDSCVFEDMNRFSNLGLNYEYTYTHNESIIYGFKENSSYDSMASGVMFEYIENLNEADKYSFDDIPPSLIYDYDFQGSNNLSVIILTGRIGNIRSKLQIRKIKDSIYGYFENQLIYLDGKKLRVKSPKRAKINLKAFDIGSITSAEIKMILEYLNCEFGENPFVRIITKHLHTFANKIDIRKGLLIKRSDLLSPNLYYNKTIEEIANIVGSNISGYFSLALNKSNEINL